MYPATILSICFLLFNSVSGWACKYKKPSDLAHFPALINVTLDDLQCGLENKLFRSVDLVHAYVDRVNEVNGTLRAVTELNPDAVAIAKELDRERKHGKIRGPLHGIPIIIKNNIATDDKMNNTAGSYALLGAKVPRDSTIAHKLRRAGAIILGKANLSQWANYRSSNSSNGWSAIGGQVEGVYYPSEDPSGSSSGSGVSSAIGLDWASLGTETDGSILSPSEKSNLASIKPSVGLTSRYLVIPISEHQDTIGPMARSVKDAAYLLQAIAGEDPRDNYTSAIPNGGALPDYVAACKPGSLSGKKFGVPRNAIAALQDNTTGPVLTAFEQSLNVIRGAGGTVVDSNFTELRQILSSQNESIVLGTEFITGLATYLAELTFNPLGLTSLQEVRNFTENFPPEEYPSRNVRVWDEALAYGYNSTDIRHWNAVLADQQLGGPGGLIGAFDSFKLDSVLLPTAFAPSFAAIIGAPGVTGESNAGIELCLLRVLRLFLVPMGFYPPSQAITHDQGGTLVETGPNIP